MHGVSVYNGRRFANSVGISKGRIAMRFKSGIFPFLLVFLLWVCSSTTWGFNLPLEQPLLEEKWYSIIVLIEGNESHSIDPVATLLLAHAYLATNQNNLAFQQFLSVREEGLSQWTEWTQSFLKKHGQHPIALYLFADAMARNGSGDKAIRYFTLALSKRNDHFYLAKNARGVAYLVNNDLDSAEVDFYLTTKDAPEFADAWANLGNLSVLREVSLGQSDMALEYFNKALAINPDFALAYNGRGCLYFGSGEFERAAHDFHTAAQLDPSLMPAEINESLATSYAFHVVNLPGLNVKPGTSFESKVNLQKAAIQERKDQLATKAPDQVFSKAVESIHRMDPQAQQAVIDKYGFDKVRSAVELNIAARQAEALVINQESLKLQGKQKILHKLELGLALAKFGRTIWGLGKDIKNVTGVGVPKAAQAGARRKGIRSVQTKVEKMTIASVTDSRTLKVVIDAANPNPVISFFNSLTNISDSILKDQKDGVRPLQMRANLQIVDLARANRGDSQFLNSRTPTGGLIIKPTELKPLRHQNVTKPPRAKSPSFPKFSQERLRAAGAGKIEIPTVVAPRRNTFNPPQLPQRIPQIIDQSQLHVRKTLKPSSVKPIAPKPINPIAPRIHRYEVPRIFKSKPVQVPRYSPAPGGVSTEELARSFVDKGNWPVITAFSLSYSPIGAEALETMERVP